MGFRVQGLDSGFRVGGLGFRILVWGLGFRVRGVGFRGEGFRVQGLPRLDTKPPTSPDPKNRNLEGDPKP